MREWWHRHTPEEKRAKTARRDPDRVRESDRRKMRKRYHEGSEDQKLRIAARSEVRKAKLRGELVPGPCEVCGSSKAHAHHDDYTKPLDVRWFCREHHEQLHEAAA